MDNSPDHMDRARKLNNQARAMGIIAKLVLVVVVTVIIMSWIIS
jgi:hypothetical protein